MGDETGVLQWELGILIFEVARRVVRRVVVRDLLFDFDFDFGRNGG